MWISLHAPPPGSRRFLTSVLLAAAALVVPTLSQDALLCYFCPLQPKGEACPNITAQCGPEQRCSSSRGRYGVVHILSAQGCVEARRCSSHNIISYRGVEYNVSHTCCCQDNCNTAPKPETTLKVLLGMVHENADNGEDAWDSCANYTSTKPPH